MGRLLPLPIGLQSSPGRYGHDAGGRLINAYAEKADDKGKAQWPIYPIAGLAPLSTLTGGGAYRGSVRLNSVGYVVSGTAVFKIDSGGGATNIGSFPGADPVFMATNRQDEILMVSGGLRYTIISDTVASIADADLPSGNSCTSLDGYGIVTIADGRVFISAIDDFTDWDALDFATAEANPDGLRVAYTRGADLVLFGVNSIEFWRNTGATFPFERIAGTALQNLGIMCRHSVRDVNDIVMFVASDGTVRVLNGYQAMRVSNHDVERAIGSISDKDMITATAYPFRGHQFYTLSSPSWSWTLDLTTGFWHERKSYALNRWRGEGYVDIDGTPAIGDYASGVLYELDDETYDEAGNHLIWTVRTPPVHAYPSRLTFDRLFIDTIPGTGLNSSNEHLSDPKVMLSWSDNGGKTFGTERTASTGQIGEFNKRVQFKRLGTSKEDGRIFQISMSAAVIRGLTGGAVDVELMAP